MKILFRKIRGMEREPDGLPHEADMGAFFKGAVFSGRDALLARIEDGAQDRREKMNI